MWQKAFGWMMWHKAYGWNMASSLSWMKCEEKLSPECDKLQWNKDKPEVTSQSSKVSCQSLFNMVCILAELSHDINVSWMHSGQQKSIFFFLETNTQYLLSKTHKSPRVLKRLIKTWLLQLSAIWFITLLAAEASQSLKHWSSDLCKSPKEVSTSILHSLSQMPGHYSIQLKASSLCYVLLNDSYVKWPDPSIYALFFLYSYHSWKL